MIFGLATPAKLPTVCPVSYFARDGGLVAYGSNFSDLFREAATYVDRILKGEKPGNLPVQDPTKYELVIILKTAKALGVIGQRCAGLSFHSTDREDHVTSDPRWASSPLRSDLGFRYTQGF
jgi:ABC-type uncharacterized transport system substrate-binding protein